MDLSAGQAIDRAGVMMGMPVSQRPHDGNRRKRIFRNAAACENQRGWDALQFFRTSKFVAKTVS